MLQKPQLMLPRVKLKEMVGLAGIIVSSRSPGLPP